MAKYVDGFVLVISKKNLPAYKKMASRAGKIWKKYGALEYKECVGDDLNIKPMGGMKPLSFTRLAKLKKNETVWFSFITYKSRKHRDQVNIKVMKDPEMNNPEWANKPMPFDMKRMAYGGFSVAVDA